MDFKGWLGKGLGITKLDREAAADVAYDPESFGPAVLFYAIGGLAGGVGSFIITGGAGFFMLISGPVFAVIGSFIGVGILHLIARLLGGRADFKGYYSALGVGSVIQWTQVVPVLGHILSLWYLPVVVVATERVHRISTARAILVVLIPALLVFVLALVGIAMLGMAVVMSLMNMGGMQGM